MKEIYFIAGLPRSGSSLISNILKQNPKFHSETISSLSSILNAVNVNWMNFEQSQINPNFQSKFGVLKSILNGYYEHVDKPIIFDRDLNWIPQIGLIEEIFQKPVKILVCVRNPAEILTSFEKLRKESPLILSKVDSVLKESSSVASRAYYYAGPDGILGTTHRNLKDAVSTGYLDRFLFVEYNKFCNMPKKQTNRIYDFFNLEYFEHDFQKIVQNDVYNETAFDLPNQHKLKSEVSKTTVNCVQYLGLDLYEQYNREIFWNAWI